jgi:hypothetical protein
VDVTWPQRASLQITVLVEHEQRMVAGAREVPVVGRALLRAVGRAHAAVDIEHQRCSRPSCLDAVDPVPGQVGECSEVPLLGHRARLEAAHLARGRGLLCHGTPTDDPSHRRIRSEAVGTVHVLVAGEAPEHRLA